jgi:hypothetical protein
MSLSNAQTNTRTVYANRDATAVSTTKSILKLDGTKWNAVLTDPVLSQQLATLLTGSIAAELGIPQRFVRIIRFYLGSLVAEVAITRNETFPISDTQIAIGLNNNDVYSQISELYTNVTGEVSGGLLEPVVLIQIVPVEPSCGEVCIGICSGASVLAASAAFSVWYICFYANEGHSKKQRKRKSRPTEGNNEPLEHSSNSDKSDSEPFNEPVLPPNASQEREPVEQTFRPPEEDERQLHGLHTSSPYGAPDEMRHSAFDYSSPYGGPSDQDFSPRPAHPPADVNDDRNDSAPLSPGSRSTSSVNINSPSVFEDVAH